MTATPTLKTAPADTAGIGLHVGPLILRPPTPTDISALANIVRSGLYAADEKPMVSWYHHDNPEGNAANVAHRLHASWRTHPITHAQFVMTVDGAPVGMAALNHTGHTGTASTGSWISPHFRGRGYATCARWALLALAFDVLGVNVMRSRSEPGNYPSLRVSEKCGYISDGTDTIVEDGETVTLNRYRIDVGTWAVQERPPVTITGTQRLRSLLVNIGSI